LDEAAKRQAASMSDYRYNFAVIFLYFL
jgi:hypothetical protein